MSRTRICGVEALESLIQRGRDHGVKANQAAQQYNERNDALICELQMLYPAADEREMVVLLKQAKEKDLILEGFGRAQEFHARESVRCYTQFQAELAYRQAKEGWDRDLHGLLTGRIPRQAS